MIEIDHALQTARSEPEPAKPILASQLLELEVKQRTRFTCDRKPERLSTACTEIDELLGGNGIERGVVVGISGEGGDGRLISLNLLASILVSHLPATSSPIPKTRATVIDTTGSFPLSLLAKLLKSRILASRVASVQQTTSRGVPNPEKGEDEQSVDADVQRCLEMVGISRVFDLEGLWEVLSEVGRDPTALEEQEQEILDLAPEDVGMGTAEVNIHEDQSTEKELEIPNSDDDLTPISSVSPGLEDRVPNLPRSEELGKEGDDEGVEIIIIDTITHVINELFSRKQKSDVHALLSLLSLTITNLSQTTNILTILHNTTVPSTSSTKSTYYNLNHQQQQARASTQSSSVFPSNPLKPALGQIFTQFPSLHLFLSNLPKGSSDAEALYNGEEENTGNPKQRINYCTVLEVLKDETPNLGESKEERWFGYREGTWCAVEVDSSGTGLKSAFEEKGTRRGMDMERDRGKVRVHGEGRGEFGGEGREVSNIAKVWGFGGRRV